ncbi:hypothetical protein JL475_25525 [Streptomyces sp. M2CJ-2]|uniref:hypothetical protein n=1 Tax=Streptomyces sp. M2CJ-2 TaxID=2803948 RepID=UPI001926C1A6|nr:hypothetical protein [Streptomyces sp. M2CJ-2]MBL3669287.1 hypothetical protein [Streptomyces sp. M2CJ-2]
MCLTEIAGREHRRGHELDLVVAESPAFGAERITAIGEAKGTLTPVGLPQLERLEHLRGLLPSARVGSCRSSCFSPALASPEI